MGIYECDKCGWKGASDEVVTIQTHEYMGIDEEEVDEEDRESLEVCPRCVPYQLVYGSEH